MHSLISLVDDNHMDNKLKEIFVYVFYGSVVNNQPKNDDWTLFHMHAATHGKRWLDCTDIRAHR